jgi:ribosomal protein L7/L12
MESEMDMIKFVQLVLYLTDFTGLRFTDHELKMLQTQCKDLSVTPAPVDQTVLKELMQAVKYGRKIEAIKAYRTLTGEGLKESKDIIETVLWAFVG